MHTRTHAMKLWLMIWITNTLSMHCAFFYIEMSKGKGAVVLMLN